ncbi:carboxypeptidase-like regulatory domain-containing protein [Paralcaligenes ureilyticus]|uniref:Carboxypeptidase family protein n=1 Tax=Paralcaligenes ureilyticus TaxID=627131 RepID=A0A4R3M9A7_9BURK|nr:carboxypeptidase-like regulatory domain-containing protein [Paralcaligenes ureilyticus]TCT10171.1 hypothetical protein EDC26_102127 [Paralcaligenes ureilyticus]
MIKHTSHRPAANTVFPSASKPASQTTARFMLAAILLIGALAYTQAHAELPPLHHQGSTDYVSGGIGIDESTAFKAAMSQFPLALTFASNREGNAEYVSDVQVVVRDSQSKQVLNVVSEGPYFLARLPAGKYEVLATYQGKTQSRKADIGGTGTARLMFEWK